MPDLVPLPALPSSDPWWRIESLDWDFGDAVDLDRPTGISFNDRANTETGASLTLQTSDAATQVILAEHRVIRYSVLDLAATAEAEEPVYRPLFAALADQPKATVIAPGEDADEQATIRARSILAQWRYVEVDPPGGAGAEPDTPVRAWNFSHSSIDIHSAPWTDATYRSMQGDATTGDPNGNNGQPYSFSYPGAYWLAPTPVPGTNDYNGIFLLGFDYELADDSQIVFDCCGRNAFQVWVNERLLGSVWDYPDGDASGDTWRASGHFEAGTLRVRVAVGNFPNLGPGGTTGPNGGLFALAAFRPIVGPGGVYDEELLFSSASGQGLAANAPGRWRALDYTITNNQPPGPRVGQPIIDVYADARARGQLAAWDLSFTATAATDGTPWPEINGLAGFVQDVGTSGASLIVAMRDAGLIEFDVTLTEFGVPVLHAWLPGTAGSAKPDGLVRGNVDGTGNLLSLEYDVDHSGALDQLLVSYANGTVRVGSGPKSGFVTTDAMTVEEAEAFGLAQLAQASRLASVTADAAWLDQDTGPYWGWGKLDTIPAVDTNGLPADARVMGFNVSADDATGRPLFVPVLEANPSRPDHRVALSVQDLALGNLGGRTAATIRATGRQRPMEKVDLITLRWSVPGLVASLTSGLEPPEHLMRLTRLLVTVRAGTGTANVTVAANGSSVAAASVTGTTEAWVVTSAVLRPTHRVQAITAPAGGGSTQEDIVIVGYGSPMGVPAVPRAVTR